MVKIVDGAIVERAVHLIRPPTRQFVFTHIHGLTWNDVEAADDFGGLWPKLAPLLEGAAFLQRITPPSTRVSCAPAARLWPRNTYAAVPLYGADRAARVEHSSDPALRRCRELKIALNHHEALSDATACAEIVLAAHRADLM